MIKLASVTKEFADRTILKKINLNLGDNQIVGLIGENGVGKSTLLKIIKGDILPDLGSVDVQNEKLGFLPQKPIFPTQQTVEQFLNSEPFLIESVLAQVSLTTIDQNTLAKNLSGGEKTKLYLASLLLAEPTFLLLDEPTNNLDLGGIEWLESFLARFNRGILLVTHDRALLDNLVDKIIEIEKGEIKTYGGNYSFYLEQKELQRLAYLREYTEQQKRIAKIEENVRLVQDKARQGENKFSARSPYERRKIRKAAEQSARRKKNLEKFLESEKRLEKPEDKVHYTIEFSGKTNSGKSMLSLKNITKTYADKRILKHFSLQVTGQEHVWLSGKNGSGKTTLLKIIVGEERPDSGQVEMGTNIKAGYYSQDRAGLNVDNLVIDELIELGLSQTESYKLAIKFGFIPDDLKLKIKNLSTGQKAKLAFAKLTSGFYQLLILDEPTNHLEIKTREILEEALNNYQGAFLVSSHDRYFLDRIKIDRVVNL